MRVMGGWQCEKITNRRNQQKAAKQITIDEKDNIQQ